MGNPLYGSDNWLGIGEESTYDTPATRTAFFEPTSDALDVNVEIGTSKKLRTRVARGHFEARRSAGGVVGLEFGYSGYGKILKHLMGSTVSAALTVGQSYRHEFARGASLPVGLTLERNLGAKNQVYPGAKVVQGVFRWTPGEIMAADLTFAARRVIDNSATPTTPTFIATERLVLPQYGVLTWGVTDVTPVLKSVEVTVGNNLKTDRYFIGATAPGAPIFGGISETRWKLELEADDAIAWGLWTDYIAATRTTRKLKLVLNSGVVIGSSADTYLLKLESPVAQVVSTPHPVNDKGVLGMTVEFLAADALDTDYDRDSDQTGDLKFTLQNSEATP